MPFPVEHPLAHPGSPQDTSALSTAEQARLALVHVPFVENRGQFSYPDAAYVADVFSGKVAVAAGEISYHFDGFSFAERFASGAPVAGEPGPTAVSYFLGSDQTKWQTGLGSYESVTLPGIAPGIDLVLQARQGTVEKVITVQPGADPDDIHFTLSPGSHVTQKEDGRLLLDAGGGQSVFSTPVAWQEIDGARRDVRVAYAVERPDHYGFTLGTYDPAYAVVIDPVFDTLSGSTYLGGNNIGSGNDRVFSIKLKSNGQIVAGGFLKGTGLATSGAYDESANGGTEAFLALYNADVSSLVALTYIGGSNTDYVQSIDVDSSGNVYAVGSTRSTDFPTTAGADSTYNGGDPSSQFDLFVVKMNSTLTSLTASSYFGGNNDDEAAAGVLDGSGNFWVTGITYSSDFPLPNGGSEYDRSVNGDADGIVAKWNSTLSTSTLTTFLGGSGYDYPANVSFDSGGNVWIGGLTYSTDFPTTGGVIDTTGDSSGDGFISVFPSTLASLSKSTYFGGAGLDEFWSTSDGVQFDASGNAYILGDSATTNLATTVGAYDRTHNGDQDVIILKINSALTSILALTYLGGSGTDYGTGMRLSGDKIIGTIFYTTASLPVTSGAFQGTRSSNSYEPAFFRMSSDLTTLDGLSYLMGNDAEGGQSDSIDDFDYTDGKLIISGQTGGGLRMVDGSYDRTYAGNTDGFIAVITTSADPAAPAAGHTPSYEEINPPYAPTPRTPEALSTSSIRWNFQDRSQTEGGFRIVDAVNGTVYVTTEPVAAQNLAYLDEAGLAPGTTYCHRAVVALNGIGASPISAQNTYPCFATLPTAPAALTVTGRMNTEIRFNNQFTQHTENGPETLYGIRELTSGKWVTPVAASGSNPYILDGARSLDVASQWPETIILSSLTPGTAYQFVPVSSQAGATVVDGATVGAATISQAPALQLTLTARVFTLGGALAAIGTLSNIATPLFTFLVLILTGMFVWLNRKAGGTAIAHGLWHVVTTPRPAMTYHQFFMSAKDAPSYIVYREWHVRLRRGMQCTVGVVLVKVFFLLAFFAGGLVPGHALASTSAGRGDRIQYTIHVENTGAGEATAVVVTNTLPTGLTYVANSLTVAGQPATDAADGDAGTLSTSSLRFTVASVPAGGGVTLAFDAIVTGEDAAGGPVAVILNQVCATAAEVSEPACSNMEDTTVGTAPVNVNQNTNTNTPEPEVNTNTNSNANTNTPQPDVQPAPEEAPPVHVPIRAPEPALLFPPSLRTQVGQPERIQQTAITVNGRPAAEPTNDATPEIGGVAAGVGAVTVAIDGTTAGTARLEAGGKYHFIVPNELSDGVYRIVIRRAGTELDAADMTIDTVPPRPPLQVRIDFPGLFPVPDAAGTVRLRLGADLPPDTSRVDVRVESEPQLFHFETSGGNWQEIIAAALEPGEHSVSVQVADRAGNLSPEVRRTFAVSPPGILSDTFATVGTIAEAPLVQQTAQGSVPVLAVVTAAGAAATAGVALPVIQFFGLLFTQPVLLFYRRRRSGYGVIYNVLTKMPVDLAVVRLKDPVSGRVVQTKVTDRAGRYLFSVLPGIYTLEVQKMGFRHPTQFLRTPKDAVFADVSIASRVTVGPDGRFSRNIPIDPEQKASSSARLALGQWARRVQAIVAVAGPTLSLGATVVAPTRINMVLAGCQVAIFGLVLFAAQRRARRGFGVVRDAQTGKPVPGAVVRIFETTYNRLLETQVTDSHGRYGFLVGPNSYFVDVQKDGFRTYRSSELDLHRVAAGALLGPDVRLAHGVAEPVHAG